MLFFYLASRVERLGGHIDNLPWNLIITYLFAKLFLRNKDVFTIVLINDARAMFFRKTLSMPVFTFRSLGALL